MTTKPDTNSETKSHTISARQSLYNTSDYTPEFDDMLDTPFNMSEWNVGVSFTDSYCDYCGQLGKNCDC